MDLKIYHSFMLEYTQRARLLFFNKIPSFNLSLKAIR